MKRYVLTISLMFALILSYSAAQPKLEIIGGDTYDWKDVKPNDSPVKTDIQIKNTGNKKLNINEVKPSCGCTSAPLDKNELEPGESTVIHIKLNLPTNSGPVTKTVYISSNDPQQEKKILYLKANLIKDIDVLPTSYMSFEEMKVGQEKTVKLKIKNNSRKDVTLSDFQATPSTLSINLNRKKVLKPGEELELVAKAKPDKKGYYNCTVSMKSNLQDYQEIKIQGFGNVSESAIFNNN